MEKILIPVDFSEASDKALAYGVALAKDLNAHATLFYAFHPVPYAPEMLLQSAKVEWEEIRKLDQARLMKLSEKIMDEHGLNCNFITKEGFASEQILAAQDEFKPQLTILGTHGTSGFSKAVLGSVTADVAGQANYPVMVVPEHAAFKPITKMVFATDFHDSDIEGIRYLTKLSKDPNAEIVVLHVADGDTDVRFEETFLRELEQEVREKVNFPNVHFHLTEDPNISRGIEEFAENSYCDLVAVSKVKRGAFLKVFLPSITKKMIYHTKIPLLVFNAWDTAGDDF